MRSDKFTPKNRPTERPYVYKNTVTIPETTVPTTKCGLGKGRSALIEFRGQDIPVRLHKYTNSVASDQFGNVYMETAERINHGTVTREWICDKLVLPSL